MCETCGCGDPNLVSVDVHENILAVNDRTAAHNREHFDRQGVFTVNLMGSGDINLGEISASKVVVNVIGSGDAAVWANNSLAVSILGSGDVSYRGDVDPQSSILGSGEVVRRD